MKIVFSSEAVADIVECHVNKHEPPCVIARRYDCSSPVIYRLLVSQGAYRVIGTRRYFFNEDYFAEIDMPRKAYWLGLFYADACVAENNTFTLGFKREDRYILEALAADVGYEGDLYDYENVKSINGGENKPYPSSTIALCSKKFAAHLDEKGVVRNKTFRLKFPDIASYLRKHFVRGLFDGDGYISVNNYAERTHIQWGIVGQEQLLEVVNKVVAEEVGIAPAKVHRKTGENCWGIRYATSIGSNVRRFDTGRLDDILAIKKWLYEDACLCFKRKKYTFDTIKPVPTRSGLSLQQAAEHIGCSKFYISTKAVRERMGLTAYQEGMYVRFDEDCVKRVAEIYRSMKVRPWDKRLEHIGENNQAAKLTEQKVLEIRKAREAGATYNDLAVIHGVTPVSIRNICIRKTWSCIK